MDRVGHPRHDHQVIEGKTSSKGDGDRTCGSDPRPFVSGVCRSRVRARRDCRIVCPHNFLNSCVRMTRMALSIRMDEAFQAYRAISTGQLHALLRFHTRPINVVVFHGSQGRSCFEGGFPLRCFQRLSRPYIATLHCRWRDNRSTRGTFTPVLSY